MRVGVGKKVGGVYVGGSVSTKSIWKGIGYVFGFPFILCYYMCIWPFIKIYKHIKNKNEKNNLVSPRTVNLNNKTFNMSPIEAKNAIPSYSKIFNESIKLVNETKTPAVFFERWDKAIESIEILSVAGSICGTNSNANEILSQLTQNKTYYTNQFIDRYASVARQKIYELSSEKAKLNKANAFTNILLEYQDKMTQESLEYLDFVSDSVVKSAYR